MRSLICAALVLRLLVDIATPLMPGAFRFNPEESVDANAAHSVRAVDHASRAASPPQPVALEVVKTRPRPVPQSKGGPLRCRPPRARHTPEHVSETPEDPLIAALAVV